MQLPPAACSLTASIFNSTINIHYRTRENWLTDVCSNGDRYSALSYSIVGKTINIDYRNI
ncbi:hypothetical protein [Aerosakkonema funiforme]|uniref:hypothetical protein n=1 Tax=Aerosakkonema funiforme TaxID=1246630 RepID=UPI001683AA13|nr:hypothetical protein [Aerosakkonema funiforme]